MKVLLGVHHYPPTNTAGVELITERLAKWLIARGHSLEVVCVENIDADRHFTVRTDDQDGVVVHRLGLKLAGTGEHLGLRYRDDALGEWFERFLTRTKPDVFHSHSSYLLTASLIEAAGRTGVPIVATLHDYWFLCPRLTLLRSNGELCVEPAKPSDCTWCLMAERRPYRLLDTVARTIGRRRQRHSDTGPFRWPLQNALLARIEERQVYLDRMLRSVDQIVTPAPLGQERVVANGIPSERVRLVRYGLDLNQWQGLPVRVPKNRLVRIGYLGQLAPHKGVHVLVQAFRRLSSEPGRLELEIHGDPHPFPKYVATLKRLIGNHPGIRFCGPYGNHQVHSILAAIDVLVIPSLWFEVSPLVILEAFASGVPIVASRMPNLQVQIRDGVNGLFFTPADAADLARQLQRLRDEPDLLGRLAQGIGRVRSIQEEFEELESVYRSVVRTDRRETLSTNTEMGAHRTFAHE